MAEAAAARALCGFVPTLLILVLELLALHAGSLTVEMAGKTQTVLLNHNVTISCLVPGFSHLDTNIMGVIWFWKNPVTGAYAKVFELVGEHQKAYRSGASVSLQELAKGNASLQLPGVQISEEGEYQCNVNTPDRGQGTVFLGVRAYPELSVEESKVKDNDYKRLVCKASGFYPPLINIMWCKWNQENSQCLNISENVTTSAVIANVNRTGTFSVTSNLKLSPEHGGTYECVVEHMSSSTPQRQNITLPADGSEPKSNSWTPFWIVVSCLAVVVVLVLLIIGSILLCKRNHRCNWTHNQNIY